MRKIKYRIYDPTSDRFTYFDLGIDIGMFDSTKVSEFMGMVDKEGKDVYEGDILEDAHGHTFEIRWNKDESTLKAIFTAKDGKEYFQHFRDIEFMKVIGNIYMK